MKIIILGAGQVGSTLAEHLSTEDNDVTVIDIDGEKLLSLQERIDIRTVCGPAAYPSILMSAGAEDADLLIAVTNSDETNMIACQTAYCLFRTPTKIARIRSTEYAGYSDLFGNDSLPIDKIISPEHLVMQHIKRLIEHPDALQVVNFANGRIQLAAVKAFYGGPLVGHALGDMKKHMPKVNTKIVAIFRRNKAIMPAPDTIIQPDDEIFFLATPKDLDIVMSELRHLDQPYKRVIIAGGGNIGAKLAEALESDFNVKIIEHSLARTQMLATQLRRSVVLHGDAADKELLLEENIHETDVFCAVTNHDEANIMSSILAKRLGAHKVIAIINRPAYVDVVEGGDIDIAISPQQITFSSLLAHVRRGDVVNVHSLRRGAAEAIEAIAHGDQKSSKVIGKKMGEIKLPWGTTIGAIVRNEEVFIADDNLTIAPEDHVILFVTDKRQISEVEKLFQVGITFV
ncbi:Trk system potassium transporter TrkA [Candidatus Berkiella cookevillensis]|uniref:Trk system potassium uptake protein TrkA n=1 Tax=Candidatus Berkiella cookevillensis TaxID=437022 RepID=A0A0Q9YMZ4_9GAMM|nr:Trk system potassium transporter TrkA [Candidatus Berkiella cookevillensis]MCS5707292.1 Trk system potassium transporter TrkA [Candidatus Berkiella cookevillensis]